MKQQRIKRQNLCCFSSSYGERQILSSSKCVPEKVGQNIQPETAQTSHFRNHPNEQVYLPFHAAVTWRKTLRTCVS